MGTHDNRIGALGHGAKAEKALDHFPSNVAGHHQCDDDDEVTQDEDHLDAQDHLEHLVNGPSENQGHERSQEHAVAQDLDERTLGDRQSKYGDGGVAGEMAEDGRRQRDGGIGSHIRPD